MAAVCWVAIDRPNFLECIVCRAGLVGTNGSGETRSAQNRIQIDMCRLGNTSRETVETCYTGQYSTGIRSPIRRFFQ